MCACRVEGLVLGSCDASSHSFPPPTPHPHPPHDPQARQQLAQMAWVRQSEAVVLEALTRLAAVGEEVAAAAAEAAAAGEGARR